MVEVTDADRELFITITNADGQMAERIRCGEAFTWEVEQLARHRLAEREAAVKWLREQDGHGYDDMRANCLEAGEHRK